MPRWPFSKLSQTLPGRTALALPILTPLVVTIGLTTVLTHRIGQQVARRQAEQFHRESSLRVEERLDSYFSLPASVLQLTSKDIDSEVLDPQNFEQMQAYFWKQSQVFEQFNEIYWGSSQGESLGVIRRENGSRELATSELKAGSRSLIQLDESGNSQAVLTEYSYDPRVRPWYKTAAKAKKIRWSNVYRWSNRPILGITLAQPSFDADSELRGVLAIDLNLESIQQFLQQLAIAQAGQVLIIDRAGFLIASSTAQPPFIKVGDEIERIQPVTSNNRVMSGVTRALEQEIGGFVQLQEPQTLRYNIEGTAQLVQITPWKDIRGLDWLVVVIAPEDEVVGQIIQNTRATTLLNSGAFLLALLASLFIAHQIAKQMQAKRDEIVEQRNTLQSQTQELTSALETLEAAQEKMIESATMAALGQLVAGVAHEINTPVGTAILAASTLDNETKLVQRLETPTQRSLRRPNKTALEDYLEVAEECNQIILENLRRAGELVGSFKRVAVDRSQQQRRAINLKSYIKEVLQSLSPRISHSLHEVKIIGNNDLLVETDPGAIAQIVTNLIVNSLTHGFHSDQAGIISLEIHHTATQVEMIYQDNGKGIEPAIIGRIFDPFFTTGLSRQNTGLGLYMVYNLVTQRLGGNISVHSVLDQGTQFKVTFPLGTARHDSLT